MNRQTRLINLKFRWSVLLAYILTISSGFAHAKLNCMERPSPDACIYVVAAKNAPIYASPNTSSPVVNTYSFLINITVDVPNISGNAKGWLPVSRAEKIEGWVEKKRVVPLSVFKPVIACWPIKTIRGSFPHREFVANFNPDGTGEVRGLEEWNADRRIQVYAWNNLIWLVHVQNRTNIMMGHVDSVGKIFFRDAEIYSQTLFDRDALSGCSSRPRTQ